VLIGPPAGSWEPPGAHVRTLVHPPQRAADRVRHTACADREVSSQTHAVVDLQRAFEWQQEGFSQTVLVFKAYQPFKSRVHLFELQVVAPATPPPQPLRVPGAASPTLAIAQPELGCSIVSVSMNRCGIRL
jgi:hypothetical protein